MHLKPAFSNHRLRSCLVPR